MTQEFLKNLGEGGREQTIHDVSIVSSQNVTFNQTQIIQISVEEVKTRKFIITSPYKGLKKFESEDKDRFFGRDQFLTGLVNELEQSNFVLLLGASGSGKSSAIRAGLIPWLAERQGSHFVNLVLTPDQDPFESLYASLLGKYKQSEAQIARIAKEDTLTQLVRSLKQQDAYWFILIDQFEELFTTTESSKRDVFIKSLVQLVKTLDKAGDRSVKLVATMRADFLDRLSPYPDLIKLTDKHRPMIAEMQLDELRLAIEQPAAHHGVVFEAGLVKQIIDDVQGQAGYLPLLQYTLYLLWETEFQSQSIEDRTLNISNYRELGGVRGALQKHVDQIYKSLSESEKLAAQRIFLKLVGIGEDEESGTEWKPVRRRATRSEFSDSLEQTVLTQLVNQNLLVSNRIADSQESTIEIAHEALLTSWVTLNTWIKENRQAIALRNRLNDDVEQWKKTKSHEDLWSGSRLAQALELRKDETFNQVLGGLSQEANQFLDASQGERDRQLRQARITAIFGLILAGLASIAALFATYQFQRAERQRMKQYETNAKFLASSDPAESLIYGLAAIGLSRSSFVRLFDFSSSNLLSEKILQSAFYEVPTQTVFQAQKVKYAGDSGLSVAVSADGQTIVTGSQDGTIRLWDRKGKPLTPPLLHKSEGARSCVNISADGKTIVSAGFSLVKIWDRHGKLITHPIKDTNGGCSIAISSDGQTIVSGGDDGTVRLWNRQGESISPPLHGHQGDVVVAMSSDGQTIVSGGDDGTVRLWNRRGESISPPLHGHQGKVRSVAISSNGRTIASGGDDGTVRLWNHQGQPMLNQPLVHQQKVSSVAVSSNGQIVVSISADSIVKVWNQEGTMLAHYSPGFPAERSRIGIGASGIWSEVITGSVTVSADGMTIISASDDLTVRVWNYLEQLLTQPLHLKKAGISSLAIAGDGNTTVMGNEDGSVYLWNPLDQAFSPAIQKHKGKVYSMAISADGQTVVSVATDGIMKVWNRKGQSLTQIFQTQAEELIYAAVSADGQSIISGSERGTLILWNRQDKSFKQIFKVQTDEIRSVAISGDGQTIVSGQKNCTLRLWNQQGKEISQPLQELRLEGLKGEGILDVSCDTQSTISADGKIIVGSTGSVLGIWDRQSRLKSLLEFSPLVFDEISAIAISADGQTITSGHSNGIVRLWTPEGKALSVPFPGYENSIRALAMAATRKNIISVDYQGNIQFLPAEWKGLLQATCDKLRDFLPLKEPKDDVGREAKKTCDHVWNGR